MPTDGSFSATAGALELCRDVDLLIHDAQYTPTEFRDKSTWGHCTIEYAVWLAAEAGVKQLALFHHDPAHTDDVLDVARCRGCRLSARRWASRSSPPARASSSTSEGSPRPPRSRAGGRAH